MDAQSNRPIIIKRKKVVAGDGHHGGAWKVAYADFVTAMMAFFMLMWLLNATTEQQRKGIADYFSPSIPINRVSGGGDGLFSGDDIFATDSIARSGTGGASDAEGDSIAARFGADAEAERMALEELEAALLGMGGETMLDDNSLRHIVTRLTDEGLVIELFDVDGAPLFSGDTDAPMPVTVEIVEALARVLDLVTNDVAISGHLRTQSPLRVDFSPWDLSTSRAGRMRLMLESGGLSPDRIARLTGKADRDPVSPDPQDLRNNRIELIVLRSDL